MDRARRLREIALKDCPFCDQNAELKKLNADGSAYCVQCTNCRVKTIAFVGADAMTRAINRWNAQCTAAHRTCKYFWNNDERSARRDEPEGRAGNQRS